MLNESSITDGFQKLDRNKDSVITLDEIESDMEKYFRHQRNELPTTSKNEIAPYMFL